MLLHMRTFLATDKVDYEAWMQAVAPQFERVAGDSDFETLLLNDLESLEQGVSDRVVDSAAMVHMRWLVNRHGCRWPLTQLSIQVRWLGVSNKVDIYQRMCVQRERIQHSESCAHNQVSVAVV